VTDNGRETATATVTVVDVVAAPVVVDEGVGSAHSVDRADGADSAGGAAPVGLPPMFEVAAHARRARIPAAVFAVVALIVASVLGHWLIGVGACIGVVLGNANAKLLQASMVRFTAGAMGSEVGSSKPQRKQFVLGGFARLGLITVAVIVLVALVHQLGWGLLLGLAGFQLILLGFSGFAMWKQLSGEVSA
jgi:hypothetical protein